MNDTEIPFEPFKIKTVEPIKMSNEQEREKYLEKAAYNPFNLNSDEVMIDLLTDSGTSAMSEHQWGRVMEGDESYAGSTSWNRMKKRIVELTGIENVLPVHQGRAGERILFEILGEGGKYFFSNTHFDTTRANIENFNGNPTDLPIPESLDFDKYHPFKGNLDTNKLKNHFSKKKKENIGGVILTMTNNSGGGQPVSMKNVKEVASICNDYGVLFLIDCCRIAENSWFIKNREKGYENVSPFEIAKEVFSYADGTIMSAKKDGLANMGGFVAIRDEEIFERSKESLIISEGFTTYGGLSGRDMEAVAIGLEEVFNQDYLNYRIHSSQYIGNRLREARVPIIWPVGGHAIYVDAKRLYDHIPVNQYPGQVLVCELYKKGGIRAVEIGSVMFGTYDDNKELIPAPYELVRLAFPRRVYTKNHLDFVVEVFEKILQDKKKNPPEGLSIVKEKRALRHFTAEFAKCENSKIKEN